MLPGTSRPFGIGTRGGERFIRLRPVRHVVTDDDMTGPWVLALGTLAVGVGAVAAKALRRRNDDHGDLQVDDDQHPEDEEP